MKVSARRILVTMAGAVVVVSAGSGFATEFALPAFDADPAYAAAQVSVPPVPTDASWETMLRAAPH